MTSSTHSHSLHHTSLYPDHGSFRLEALLTNRPTLSDFNAAFEAVKEDWSYETVTERTKEHFVHLEEAIAAPCFNWASLTLEQRRTLVSKILPNMQRSAMLAWDARRPLLVPRNVGKELNADIDVPQTVSRPSLSRGRLFWAQDTASAAQGLPPLELELLTEMTRSELNVLVELARQCPAQYTTVQQILIAVHEAGEQESYDALHPHTLNPLLQHNPPSPPSPEYHGHFEDVTGSIHGLIHDIASGYRESDGRAIEPAIADPLLAEAWEWAMKREFTLMEIMGMFTEERTVLVRYLGNFLNKTRPVDFSPQNLLDTVITVASVPARRQHHQSAHYAHYANHPFLPPAHSLSHFHPRLNLRQAAFYGTTPGAYAEGRN